MHYLKFKADLLKLRNSTSLTAGLLVLLGGIFSNSLLGLPSIFLLTLSLAHIVQAAPGELDKSFDDDGKVTTNFATFADGRKSIDEALAVAIQGTGSGLKIVVVGFTNAQQVGTSSSGSNNFALARYNFNGSPDSTFGTGGIRITDFMGKNKSDVARAVAIQSTSSGLKIVVAGFTNVNGSNDFALARYNFNGSLDSTFGTVGMVITNFAKFTSGSGTRDEARAIAIQGDKIVVAGFTNAQQVGTSSSGSNNFALARYCLNGKLDNGVNCGSGGFGTGGMVITNFTTDVNGVGSLDDASSIKIQGTGSGLKIVVAGVTSTTAINGDNFAIARYDINGKIDTSFGIRRDGKVITNFRDKNDEAFALAIQDDLKIVAAGLATVGDAEEVALARYCSDGKPDSVTNCGGFGNGGIVDEFIDENFGKAVAVAIQDDRKIVTAGDANSSQGTDFALTRFNPNGTVDTSFTADGTVTTDFLNTSEDGINGIAIQNGNDTILGNDLIVTVGGFKPDNGTSDFALARYHAF